MLGPSFVAVDVDLLQVPENDIVFQDVAFGTDGLQITRNFPDDFGRIRTPNYYLDGNGTRRGLSDDELAFTPVVDDNVFEGAEDFKLRLDILYPSFVTILPGFDVHVVTIYDNDGKCSTAMLSVTYYQYCVHNPSA